MYNLNSETEQTFFPRKEGIILQDASGKTGIRYSISLRLPNGETGGSLYMSELPSNCHSIYLSSMGGETEYLIKLIEWVIKYAKLAKYTKFYYADNTTNKEYPKVACRNFYNFKEVGKPFTSVRTASTIQEFTADVNELYEQITTPPAKPEKAKTK